ncbi:MAG: NUDIX hydrolase [Pseudomonadota bacterium]
MTDYADVPIRPASTVVLLRDGDDDLEVLMVQRNRKLVFAGGFWVFPGGAVDDADRERANGDEDEAARIAASREAQEEAGVTPDPNDMVLISHWTTPVGEPRRFSTWIYAGAIEPDATITIDGGEIHDHQWIGVGAAIDKHIAGNLQMLPPTYITLLALRRYRTTDEALAGERETPCPRVIPLMLPIEGEGGFITLYEGDVSFDSGDMSLDGPKHRTTLQDGRWVYEYSGVTDFPPLYPQD